MEPQDELSSPGSRPASSRDGRGGPSRTTSSTILPSHASPAQKYDRYLSGDDHGNAATTIEPGEMAHGRDVAPWEPITCERLVEEIGAISDGKNATAASASPAEPPRTLDEVMREAAMTIRYNAKWFAETPLIALIETALRAATSSSASIDLYAALMLVDAIGTFALLPQSCLPNIVRFVSYTYYQGSRMFKLKKLSQQAWTVSRNILGSHMGGGYINELLNIIKTHLHPRDDFAYTAGALMIISERLMLRGDEEELPSVSVTMVLISLRQTTIPKDDILREQVMVLLGVILANDAMTKDLDDNASWDIVLDIAERCITDSTDNKAAHSLAKGLELCASKFEPRQMPIVARMLVEVGCPLPLAFSKELLAAWSQLILEPDMHAGLGKLLKDLCKWPHYLDEVEHLVDRSIVVVFLHSPQRAPLSPFLQTFEDIVADGDTATEAAAILARAVSKMFVHALRCVNRADERGFLFDALCKMSVRCTEAARILFCMRADVEGTVSLAQSKLFQSSSNDTLDVPVESIYDISDLPLYKWDQSILSVLQTPAEWAVYHFFLTSVPSLLSNHALFHDRLSIIQQLRTIVCDQLENGNHMEPPSDIGFTKSYVVTQLIEVLIAILSYHRHLSKQNLSHLVSIFLKVAGSRDYSVSIHCIHALTICCYELPDLMSSYMDNVIDKMSKMVTQRYLAIHVLQLLAGLSRLPYVFRNFQTHDYKKIFGVCGNYLQSIRGTNALSDRLQTPSSDRSSKASGDSADALPQYVYALAHHVITFWYLALRTEDRQELKEYIASCLRYTSNDGREVIEDQGLVTIDLMDRIEADGINSTVVEHLNDADGQRRIVTHRLAGLLLITTETALRTSKTIVTIRRASGTVQRLVRGQGDDFQVGVTVDRTEEDYICIFPNDTNGHTYGKVSIPRPSSALGSPTTITLPDESQDAAVRRAIESFDRTPALDSHKAGLIYIGEKQHTEDQILQNVMGSPDYTELIDGLGTLERLKGAEFNTQGLDRSHDTDGQHVLVWQNEVTQLIFHVTTLMPNHSDVNQNTASKKRHIGNDYVNIIFNNSGAPFSFNTFPSAFNYVYIIITPSARTTFLQTRQTHETATTSQHPRFYKVHVLTRAGYPAISSAVEEKVVSADSLPTYVRNLALNECVFSLMWSHKDEAGEYPSSWRSRLLQLRRLRERYESRSV